MIIEMAARLSGGDFSEGLVPLGTGINYVKEVIRIALGEEPIWSNMEEKYSKAVANRYFFIPTGKLDDIIGLEEAIKIPEVEKINLFY